MKTKFLVTILLISWFALPVFTTASENTYEIGVSEGDQFVYELKSWDDDLAEEYLGTNDTVCELGSGAEVGAFFAWKAVDIDQSDDIPSIKRLGDVSGWEIRIEIWHWTTDRSEFEGSEDDDKDFVIFQEPDDYGLLDSIPFHAEFLPKPVEDYLKDCDWDSQFPKYNQSGYKVSEEDERVTDKISYETREWRYDGVLKTIVGTTDEGEEIYRIELLQDFQDILMGILISALVMVMAFMGIGIALRRKRDQKSLTSSESIHDI